MCWRQPKRYVIATTTRNRSRYFQLQQGFGGWNCTKTGQSNPFYRSRYREVLWPVLFCRAKLKLTPVSSERHSCCETSPYPAVRSRKFRGAPCPRSILTRCGPEVMMRQNRLCHHQSCAFLHHVDHRVLFRVRFRSGLRTGGDVFHLHGGLSRRHPRIGGGRAFCASAQGTQTAQARPARLEHFPCCWGSQNSGAAAFSLRKTPIKVAALDYNHRENARARHCRAQR